MRIAVMAAAASVFIIGVSFATDAGAAIRKPTSIAAQPLDAALRLLARERQVQMIFASEDVQHLQARAVVGNLTVNEVLDQLLSGTALDYRYIDDQTVSILPRAQSTAPKPQPSGAAGQTAPFRVAQAPASPASQTSEEERIVDHPTVTVYGRRAGESVRDVPQTVNLFDPGFIDDVGATSIEDVVRFVPSAANAFQSLSHNAAGGLTVRGFQSYLAFNGLTDFFSHISDDMINIESVEVLKGPSAIVYGGAEPGGIVNMNTKKPRVDFHSEFGVEFGTYDRQRYTVDVGGPLGQRVRARLMSSYTDTETFLEKWENKKTYVAPTVDLDITERTVLRFEGIYARSDYPMGIYEGSPIVGWLEPSVHGFYPRSFNINGTANDWARDTRTRKTGSVTLLYDFSEDLQARVVVIRTENDQDERTIRPDFGLFADGRTLRRTYRRRPDSTFDLTRYHADLAGKFATGSIAHNYLVGADVFKDVRDIVFEGRTLIPDEAGVIDLFAPDYSNAVPEPLAPLALTRSNEDIKQLGLYLQDRIEITQGLRVLLGARFTDFEREAYPTALDGTVGPTDVAKNEEWGHQIGVLYDFSDSFGLYASRVQSFVPRIQGSVALGGNVFAPEQAVQYEAGVRWDIGGSGLSGNAAVYNIVKTNVLTEDPNDPDALVTAGEVRARGVELSVVGNLLPNWKVHAGYGYLDAEVTKDNSGLQGNKLQAAPEHSFSAMTRYDFTAGGLNGLGLSANLLYSEGEVASTASQLPRKDYTIVDLGAHYSLSEDVDISLLLNNVTDVITYTGDATRMFFNPGRTYFARMNVGIN